jgi:hypothetical protein
MRSVPKRTLGQQDIQALCATRASGWSIIEARRP